MLNSSNKGASIDRAMLLPGWLGLVRAEGVEERASSSGLGRGATFACDRG